MPTYNVRVTIENRPGIADPEGATILNDLVLRGNHSSVSRITTAKTLTFTIKQKDKTKAHKVIQDLCDELRIYNPVVSKITIVVQTDTIK